MDFLATPRSIPQLCDDAMRHRNWAAVRQLIQLHPQEAGAWWRDAKDPEGVPCWFLAIDAHLEGLSSKGTDRMARGISVQSLPRDTIKPDKNSPTTPAATILADPVRPNHWPAWTASRHIDDRTWLQLAAVAIGAPLQAEGHPGALDHALAGGQTLLVDTLLRHPQLHPDSWTVCPWVPGRSWVHVLARLEPEASLLGMVLRHGADPNILDKHGIPPLGATVNPAAVKALLAAGADPSLPCGTLTLAEQWRQLPPHMGRYNDSNYKQTHQHDLARVLDMTRDQLSPDAEKANCFDFAAKGNLSAMKYLWQERPLPDYVIEWRHPLPKHRGDGTLLDHVIHQVLSKSHHTGWSLFQGIVDRWPSERWLAPAAGDARQGAWMWAALAYVQRGRLSHGMCGNLLATLWSTMVGKPETEGYPERLVEWWQEQRELLVGKNASAWFLDAANKHRADINTKLVNSCMGHKIWSPEASLSLARGLEQHAIPLSQVVELGRRLPSLLRTQACRHAWLTTLVSVAAAEESLTTTRKTEVAKTLASLPPEWLPETLVWSALSPDAQAHVERWASQGQPWALGVVEQAVRDTTPTADPGVTRSRMRL